MITEVFSHNLTKISWTSSWFAKGLSIILDQLTAHSMQKGIESNLAHGFLRMDEVVRVRGRPRTETINVNLTVQGCCTINGYVPKEKCCCYVEWIQSSCRYFWFIHLISITWSYSTTPLDTVLLHHAWKTVNCFYVEKNKLFRGALWWLTFITQQNQCSCAHCYPAERDFQKSK